MQTKVELDALRLLLAGQGAPGLLLAAEPEAEGLEGGDGLAPAQPGPRAVGGDADQGVWEWFDNDFGMWRRSDHHPITLLPHESLAQSVAQCPIEMALLCLPQIQLCRPVQT